PKRIAVRGTEWPASIGARLARFREAADIGGRDALLSQAREDLVRGIRLRRDQEGAFADRVERLHAEQLGDLGHRGIDDDLRQVDLDAEAGGLGHLPHRVPDAAFRRDRKSTRLNSSHVSISYAVFCLKKKKQNTD